MIMTVCGVSMLLSCDHVVQSNLPLYTTYSPSPQFVYVVAFTLQWHGCKHITCLCDVYRLRGGPWEMGRKLSRLITRSDTKCVHICGACCNLVQQVLGCYQHCASDHQVRVRTRMSTISDTMWPHHICTQSIWAACDMWQHAFTWRCQTSTHAEDHSSTRLRQGHFMMIQQLILRCRRRNDSWYTHCKLPRLCTTANI